MLGLGEEWYGSSQRVIAKPKAAVINLVGTLGWELPMSVSQWDEMKEMDVP